jgi:hypothetical protein
MGVNGAAHAALNSIKTTAAEKKAKEHDFCLLVKYFNSFSILLVIKIRRVFQKI